ncbi:hypothetical protein BT93_J2092 [Corymbia citriodora subsp. variegata]|nr:hypothetical protein BT93_J2092 [Corymbia citriodora subsp. variegata]
MEWPKGFAVCMIEQAKQIMRMEFVFCSELLYVYNLKQGRVMINLLHCGTCTWRRHSICHVVNEEEQKLFLKRIEKICWTTAGAERAERSYCSCWKVLMAKPSKVVLLKTDASLVMNRFTFLNGIAINHISSTIKHNE